MPMKKITFNALLNHKAHNYKPMQIEVEKVIPLYRTEYNYPTACDRTSQAVILHQKVFFSFKTALHPQRFSCGSKTEFIEKAVRFYCGYLLNKEHTATEFIAPQLAAITEGIVRGSEQNLSRAIFKIAVELGALTHMLAAMNDVDDATLHKLRLMCSDEVKRINGIINFEKAVRYQRSE